MQRQWIDCHLNELPVNVGTRADAALVLKYVAFICAVCSLPVGTRKRFGPDPLRHRGGKDSSVLVCFFSVFVDVRIE